MTNPMKCVRRSTDGPEFGGVARSSIMLRNLIVLPLLVATSFVTACVNRIPGSEGEGEGEGEAPGAVEFQTNCRACHGANGATGPEAPSIANPYDDYATFVVRNGHAVMGFIQEMPSFSEGQLSNNDLTLILAFLGSQPKPTDGQGLFERHCLNCHGADGNSGRVSVSIAGSIDVLDKVRTGHNSSTVADPDFMPPFPSSLISDTELGLISTYVQGL